jgi:hypothetical protein
MKAMILAFLAVAAIAVIADIGLGFAGLSAREMTSGPSVRLD